MEGAANGISTCVKGKFAWDFVNSSDRLTQPLIREAGKFREASWDETLDLVARRLKEIKATNGPDSLAFISSSKCTNEESYLMQKLARAVIGTNNIDNCSRYCQSPATAGLFRTVGYGGDSGSMTGGNGSKLSHRVEIVSYIFDGKVIAELHSCDCDRHRHDKPTLSNRPRLAERV